MLGTGSSRLKVRLVICTSTTSNATILTSLTPTMCMPRRSAAGRDKMNWSERLDALLVILLAAKISVKIAAIFHNVCRPRRRRYCTQGLPLTHVVARPARGHLVGRNGGLQVG